MLYLIINGSIYCALPAFRLLKLLSCLTIYVLLNEIKHIWSDLRKMVFVLLYFLTIMILRALCVGPDWTLAYLQMWKIWVFFDIFWMWYVNPLKFQLWTKRNIYLMILIHFRHVNIYILYRHRVMIKGFEAKHMNPVLIIKQSQTTCFTFVTSSCGQMS